MEIVVKIWKDPVWSKVIAVGIVWLISKAIDHIAAVQLPEWWDQAFAVVSVALGILGAYMSGSRPSTPEAAPASKENARPYQIEIHTEEGRPYHEVTSESNHVLSTVRVGVRNAGEKTLSNCRVYVEKVSPPVNELMTQSPILLENAVFNLRVDDPEQLVEVAAHWDHLGQFRFSAPGGTGFFESMGYMSDGVKRTFAIRVTARECERSALFEIEADSARRLHLKFLNYLN
ncbi:hypothetical protein [Burkholderia gladioli]|uniref:hypothetical protein n=1 Tax=Burkholderia gladioli TaxID=28095 RepID=UPI003016E32F